MNMTRKISATKGQPYIVHAIGGERVAVARGGYTIAFTRNDLAAVFTALCDLLESNEMISPAKESAHV